MSHKESKSARQRLLELMANRIGPRELATSLEVPLAILRDWLDGHSAMPDAKVVALLHLVDETTERPEPNGG